MMGSEKGNKDEIPVHEVEIPHPFYMQNTEVTVKQWKAVMGTAPPRGGADNFPVTNVSWHDVQEFVRQLNIRAKGNGEYRLPSEAEWEYACRAGTTTEYYWGEQNYEDYVSPVEYSEARGVYPTLVKPIGQKISNNWGLFDMAGNALEWCEDDYRSNYTDAPSDGSAWKEGISDSKYYEGA